MLEVEQVEQPRQTKKNQPAEVSNLAIVGGILDAHECLHHVVHASHQALANLGRVHTRRQLEQVIDALLVGRPTAESFDGILVGIDKQRGVLFHGSSETLLLVAIDITKQHRGVAVCACVCV